MLHLTGYRIHELIYESPSSRVYRGQRERDGQAVILKELDAEYPSPEERFRYRQEYELTHTLDLEGVITAYSLETHQHTLVIVFEDFGAQSLQVLLKAHSLSLKEFLTIAIQIADNLANLHAANIIHKDINPSNIVLNPTTGQLKLIDFGIATRLSRENLTIKNPNVLEGTLAYMSPEQTGRMNRSLDYRTDLYSMGVTLYELLTGQLPFTSDDPLEVVHGHLAKMPVPPCVLVEAQDIASLRIISDIIMKLLAKTAEDRYQSPFGLKADLQTCLDQLNGHGPIEMFEIGQHDVSERFRIPQTLYGREQEIQTLLSAFERVRAGSAEMMVVTGYAGIGKSTLVREIHKPLAEKRGYFISGKFDQFKRNIPYSALIQAFQTLVRQLLTESEEQLIQWKEKLCAALGPNGQVIVDVIPDVELIIGSQPAVPQLPPTQAQNRLNFVFQQFVRTFAAAEHPLAIFLDDLQWVDSPSLTLLDLFMTDPKTTHMLIVVTYRNNEVNDAHPLMLTLKDIQHAGATITTITLNALALEHVNHLIADTLQTPMNMCAPLAELSCQKTDGNPFFLTQFLHALYQERFLEFDPNHGMWTWELEKIRKREITDNVVGLMAEKIQWLPEATQCMLQFAACIGNQFDLKTLSIIHEDSQTDTADHLWAALQEGLILPLDETYRFIDDADDAGTVHYTFLHDRVQQAAYSLIDDAQKKEVHLKIGRLLLQSAADDDQLVEDNIFAIVNQFNQGREFIRERPEQEKLASLNLRAGKKAKATAAYQPSFNYIHTGIQLLSEDSWERQYGLTHSLYVEGVEAAFLSANFSQMEEWATVVERQARTVLDKVHVYEVRAQACIAQSKLKEAVKIGLTMLEMLDIQFPATPHKSDIESRLQDVQYALREKRVEDLLELPIMTDPTALAAMGILNSIFSAAYLAVSALMPLLICKQVELSIQYGNTPVSVFSYANYGLILCGMIGDIETGYTFGTLASQLLEKLNANAFKTRTIFSINMFIRHCKEHLRDTVKSFLDAYQSGLETGDVEYAAWSLLAYSYTQFLASYNLRDLEQNISLSSDAIKQLEQESTFRKNELWHQVVLNLTNRQDDGTDSAPWSLIGEKYNEENMLPALRQTQEIVEILKIYFNRLILSYLFQEYGLALESAQELQKYLGAVPGTSFVPVFHFYDSLVHLAVYPDALESEQHRILQNVSANQQKMKAWAHHAPMNYRHKWYLVEAEQARVLGKDHEATEYYDNAIELAGEHGYINEEALASELTAKFWLAKDKTDFAQRYLQKAYHAYQHWGAQRKIQDLEEKYPQLLVQKSRDITQKMRLTGEFKEILTGTIVTHSDALDFATVLKASQTIAGELALDALLTRVMDIVRENAGADYGLLLFEEAGAWVVRAGTEEEGPPFPTTIINYVSRTSTPVVLADAAHDGQFTQDPYVLVQQPKSVLCTPLLHQGQLVGILYLENRLATDAFTPERVEVLQVLSAQAAISIEHASLYNRLEHKVVERTQELADTIDRLEEEIVEREAAEKALQTYRDHLEELVEERTAELTQAVTTTTRLNEQLQQEVADRQRAEQTVRASERQYRALAEHVTDGIAIIQDCAFGFLNDALCAMFGYTTDHLLRMDPVALFREEDRKAFRERCDQIVHGVSFPDMEAVCLTSEGREIWTEVSSRQIAWEGRPAMLMTVRDITERTIREREMEERRDLLYKENVALRATMKDRYQFGDIVGKSAAMQAVYEVVAHASATEANVVIYGESGTGKELVAQTIHHLSDRRDQRFVAVNCGAIPENLFESEFFGHRKGTFTGAHRDKAGFFDVAHQGTLFLDEVGELSPAMQVKLLRALENREYIPLGDQTPKHANVRIVAATNRNLAEDVRTGGIRQDFFYRINVVAITLPPLRERREDIPLLIDHVLESYNAGKTPVTLPAAILAALYKYDWPGNIRELQNVLQRYLTLGKLDFADSVEPVAEHAVAGVELEPHGAALQDALDAVEKRLILKTLEAHQWHRGNTAAALGITRRSLQRKMNKHGLM